MTPYETDDEAAPADNHSGTRLVLLLIAGPLAVGAGAAAWTVAGEIAREWVEPAAARRIAIAMAGVAATAVLAAVVRFLYSLAPSGQASVPEPIDAAPGDDEEH